MSEVEENLAEQIERLRAELAEIDARVKGARGIHRRNWVAERDLKIAEARLRKVEELVEPWKDNPLADTFGSFYRRFHAALAEGAKRPSPPEAEGSGSAEPAEDADFGVRLTRASIETHKRQMGAEVTPPAEQQEYPDVWDGGPHSRACGIRDHKHGRDCHSNCPTCGGASRG